MVSDEYNSRMRELARQLNAGSIDEAIAVIDHIIDLELTACQDYHPTSLEKAFEYYQLAEVHYKLARDSLDKKEYQLATEHMDLGKILWNIYFQTLAKATKEEEKKLELITQENKDSYRTYS